MQKGITEHARNRLRERITWINDTDWKNLVNNAYRCGKTIGKFCGDFRHYLNVRLKRGWTRIVVYRGIVWIFGLRGNCELITAYPVPDKFVVDGCGEEVKIEYIKRKK